MNKELIKKAKMLLKEFETFNEGDLKEKLNHQKKLEEFIKFDPDKFEGDDLDFIIKMNQYADDYINAYNFIKDGGKKTFESEMLTASKGEKMLVFSKYQDTFSDEGYWRNLAETYIMQDFMELPYTFYREIFSSTRKNKVKLMNDAERKFLNQLPNTITIYRGGAEKEIETGFGVSWTLNKTIAEQFVERKKHSCNDVMVVHKLTIPKAKVVAYFNSRKEEEIIFIEN